MHIVLVLLTVFYSVIILILRHGVGRSSSITNQRIHSVSVVVAARNEDRRIGRCIESLVAQDYPADGYEIIIVDDLSTDNTVEIVRGYLLSNDNLRLVRVTNRSSELSPKKNALTEGIKAARGEIILTTDADCVAKPGWIKSINELYNDDVGLVAGFSPLDIARTPSLFNSLVQLDALSLASVAAGSFGAGFPSTCNGRNLSYRLRVFHEIGGFSRFGQFVSGDDDLFLHHVVRHTNWRVHYSLDPESIVSSEAPASFSEFFHQRTRHASKGRHYSAPMTMSLIAVYLMNVLLLVMPVAALRYPVYWNYFLGCLLMKSSTEYALISRVARKFRLMNILKFFPIAVLLHIPYVVVFGLWGQIGKFRWKGKTYHAEMRPTHEEI